MENIYYILYLVNSKLYILLILRASYNNLNDRIRRVDWGLPSLMLNLLPNNIQIPCSNFPIITPIYTISRMHIPVYVTQMHH